MHKKHKMNKIKVKTEINLKRIKYYSFDVEVTYNRQTKK